VSHVEDADPGQVVDAAVRRPAAPLRPYVDRYTGYCMRGFAPGSHRGLPSRHLTFIISLDEPVHVAAMPDRSFGGAELDAFVGGLHSSAARIEHDGTQVGIQLSVTPIGARALFGVPAAALASIVVDLRDLLGARAAELTDRLRAAGSWSDRFGILDDVLTRALRDVPPIAPELARAWDRLAASDGAVEVRAVAGEVGWSRRHLAERFRLETGLTPKVAGRVFRFERSVSLLKASATRSLADVAATCGYFDQAHLTRDWHDLAGCTPTTWLAEELPSISEDVAVPLPA
jgi:AraC-like DNA-binding protein